MIKVRLNVISKDEFKMTYDEFMSATQAVIELDDCHVKETLTGTGLELQDQIKSRVKELMQKYSGHAPRFVNQQDCFVNILKPGA